MSRIDVVVPCYNYDRFLVPCVRSVLSQSIEDLRVLIIDDASSDRSLSIAKTLARSDSRVSVISHTMNQGHIATYNEGISWSAGEYFLLLSADDLLVSGAFERAIGILDSNPDIVLAYGDCAVWHAKDPCPSIDDVSSFIWERTDLAEEMCNLATNIVPTPTAVVRTSVQKRIGGYRSDLPHAGDLEMWLRFAANGSVVRISAIQGIYRKHAAAMSNAYWSDILNEYRQRKLAFDTFFNSQDQTMSLARRRRVTNRVLADKAFQSGVGYVRRGRVDGGLQLMRWAMSVDSRFKYCPPLWRLAKIPGHDGRRWARQGLKEAGRRLR